MTWFMVGAGGAIGSMLRHGVNRIVLDSWPALRFPLATLIVNVIGCGAFGLLVGLMTSNRLSLTPHWREFLMVGILGGFTTFSAFAGDVALLTRSGLSAHAAASVLANVVLSLAAVYAGLSIGLRSA